MSCVEQFTTFDRPGFIIETRYHRLLAVWCFTFNLRHSLASPDTTRLPVVSREARIFYIVVDTLRWW